jgi:hypothetical protein
MGPQSVLQNLTNKKASVRPYPGAYEKTPGLIANPFEIARHQETEQEGENSSGAMSSVSAVQVGATNMVAYADRGILVDQ